jgi:hypothetical protein
MNDKKIIKTELPMNSMKFPSQSVLEVVVKSVALKDWLVCLFLIRSGQIDSVVFLDESNGAKLEIHPGTSDAWRPESSDRHFRASLTNATLTEICEFLGEYYRDGFAAVNHIDITANYPHGDYLTIKVEDYAPPMSPKEAKRFMDNF